MTHSLILFAGILELIVRKIVVVLQDFSGLWRKCGATVAIRWLFCVVRHVVSIVKCGNLQPADFAMGDGPFRVKFNASGVTFNIYGAGSVSGIREMYVRDTYLRHGLLRIKDGDTVVDLGANMGNFTNLALAHGGRVRVVAVEPNSQLNEQFKISVGKNSHFEERVQLIRAFIGSDLEIEADSSEYDGAPRITEGEFLSQANLGEIDFLKCDIEGGEFGLLIPGSKLLENTKSLAIEIHAFAGDVQDFLTGLKTSGFEILENKWDPDGSCTALAHKN